MEGLLGIVTHGHSFENENLLCAYYLQCCFLVRRFLFRVADLYLMRFIQLSIRLFMDVDLIDP
jgi:hypothetical protein